jgi:hypothetical protein
MHARRGKLGGLMLGVGSLLSAQIVSLRRGTFGPAIAKPTGAEFLAAPKLRKISTQSVIRKKPVPDLIRGGNRFSEEIMRKKTS